MASKFGLTDVCSSSVLLSIDSQCSAGKPLFLDLNQSPQMATAVSQLRLSHPFFLGLLWRFDP